ncbi:MAG: polyprenyl synthetase [Bacteroidetes bacterium]|nr:MAG: polyprenyl synthetase [Bacteroidota bacterium]
MKSSVPLLDKITHYIIKRKGKQLRPIFVFLSAKICGEVNEATYRAATLIELLHTATLVHDDVVDDSYQRRGFFSLNALWKNKIAVLVGDFLLSKGLLFSIDNGDFDLLKIVSNAVKEMSEGELLQIEKARKLDIEESVYFEIIRQKTASLIASCLACGACSVGADNETVEKMRTLGETIGLAFQIRDDLFDYETDGATGKPSGIDIKEKKLTLPIIHVLNRSTAKEKRWLINTIKNEHNNEEKVQEIMDYVVKHGGIEYAHASMQTHKDKALAILDDFPDSDAKESLRELITYTIERKK